MLTAIAAPQNTSAVPIEIDTYPDARMLTITAIAIVNSVPAKKFNIIHFSIV